jgi:anaphase-promoting complex subunit 1
MSEVMLSEMENLEEEETSMFQEPLRDEGYRLAAGFALGFINLAKGRDLGGLRDMRIVERLLALAVGTKNVDLVHILDRATAGATVALAIIFMKSNDSSVAEKIDVPDTVLQFAYIRPDLFLLRTLAKHLIMWDSIQPTLEWIRSNIPKVYRGRYRLTPINHLCTDDMPFFNIIAGLCFAVGLRFAGSGSAQARDLLVSYLDQFIRICRLPAVSYDAKLTRNSVRNCQDIVALSAAAVMAGTGDISVFRRLRSLHGRIDADTPYGSYMAAHMAVGMLFLGGGTHTLGTSDLAVASLLCAFYPVFPTTVLDNKCHLQAFRHLWVLAAEPRCLIPRDIDTFRPVTIPVCIALKSGQKKVVNAPCLLPELTEIARVTVQSPDHWGFTLDFSNNEALQSKFLTGDQSIYVRRRSTYNSQSSSVFSSTLMALSQRQDIPASSSFPQYGRAMMAPASNMALIPGRPLHSGSRPVLDCIFDLPSFRHLDLGEKALVASPAVLQPRFTRVSSTGRNIGLQSWLRTSVVDTRLVLDKTLRTFIAAATGRGFTSTTTAAAAAGRDAMRDRLWHLRLLFTWVDSMEDDGGGASVSAAVASKGDGRGQDDGGGLLWLPREVIEDARWKIWGIQVGDAAVAGKIHGFA